MLLPLQMQSFCVEQADSVVFCLSCLHGYFEGIKAADCAKGRGSGDAVSPDKFTEGSRGPAPEVRSLVTPPCKRGILSSETSVLRSVLKKPSGKLCLESLQVSK